MNCKPVSRLTGPGKSSTRGWEILPLVGLLALLIACGDSGTKTPPPQVSIAVSPTSQSMWVHGTQQFTATVTGSTNTAVTWAVTEAGGGTIDASGKYTAPATGGTFHITATSQADTTKSANAAITVTVPAPTFGSTPTTAAAQDAAYGYTVQATDPAGTAITLKLTTAPDGATLSGNTVSWTPSWQQARQTNAFTVTATSAAGGTATQSWAVSPTGTVHGAIQISHWSNDGTVEIESNSAAPPLWTFAALVPQPNGSLSVIPGMGYEDATFQIPQVPAGYYWLQFQPGSAVWTNASFMDYGSDAMGRRQKTPLVWSYWGCDLTGLDPWDMANDEVDFYSINAQAFAVPLNQPWYGIPTPGGTTCNAVNALFTIPLSQIPGDVASAVQFEQRPGALTFFNAESVGPAFNQPITFDNTMNGANVVISGDLTKDNVKTQDFNVGFSAWQSAFDKGGPTPSSPQAFQMFIDSRQRADALPRQNPMLFGFYPILAGAQADGNSAWPKDANNNNVWPQDGDFGTLDYNDPFATWNNSVYRVWATARYEIPFPNSSVPVFATVMWTSDSLTMASPLVPPLQPIGNPKVNGVNLLTQSTVNSASPTLTWDAPTSAGSIIYDITICEPVLNSDQSTGCNFVYDFSHYSLTSFTVPAGILTPGHSYIFAIQADARTGYDPLHPNRYSLPEATSFLISAAITVSGGAAAGVVHGDESILFARPSQTPVPLSDRLFFDSKKVVRQTNHFNSTSFWAPWDTQQQNQSTMFPSTTAPQKQ